MEPKVSIIVPIYNAEKYLNRCITSILEQTYKNIELILINDGSTDSSEEIILHMQEENKDIIKYYKQENKGVSKTRNFGITVATGKYIMFVDNDDYIDKDYVEQYVNVAERGKYDLVIGGYRRVNSKNKIFLERKIPNTKWGRYITLTPWGRIFKKSYITENDIQFLSSNIGEDIYFNIQAVNISNNIAIIEYVGYNWFYNEKSVSNTIQKNFYNLEIYKLLNESYNVTLQKGILKREEEKEYLELYWFTFIIWIMLYTGKSLNYKELSIEYSKIIDWLKQRFPNYKHNKLCKFTKPDGELLSNRIKITIFMMLHKCNLGNFAIYIYTRLKNR